jgi:hypothetical protein
VSSIAETAASRRVRASVIADRLALRQRRRSPKEHAMLYTVAIVLFVLWLLGITVFHVADAMIHSLLVMAVGAFVWHVVSGRKLA